MADTALEARIHRLEDMEAIKRLMSLYCYHADNRDGENWSRGLHRGRRLRDRPLRHLRGARDDPRWSTAPSPSTTPPMRSSTSMATGHAGDGCFSCPAASTTAPAASARYGRERNTRTTSCARAKWRFKRVKLISVMWTPFDKGWELERFISQAA